MIEGIRNEKLKLLLHKFGRDTTVGSRFSYFEGKNIEIGNDVFISHDVDILAKTKKVTIGDDCMIAQNVFITSSNHKFADVIFPMRLQGDVDSEVVIQDNVWIGAKAIILPGVTIGRGSIVGAGAVVTKNVAPYSVVGGVPARFIKSRIPVKKKGKALTK